MQYIYVLTSTAEDNYYEQFLLSAASLRLMMPNAQIILVCDFQTKENLTEKRSEYEKVVSRTITVNAPPMPQVEVSRWLKTSIRSLIDGDFLYIDCDTIITGDLSSIFNLGITFGACLDIHTTIDRHFNKDVIVNYDKKLGFKSSLSNKYYNGGIIYSADTPESRKIFSRWHELWLFCKDNNVLRDMPSLNMAIYENSSLFTELDGTWNCQIPFNTLPYLANSKIIHYFASNLVFHKSPYLFASDDIFNQIKETGVISDEIMDLLKNPKAAFSPESRIIAGDDMLAVVNSRLFEMIYWLRKKNPFLYNCLNGFSSIVKKKAKSMYIKSEKNKNKGKAVYN